jgi:hypothetical protein
MKMEQEMNRIIPIATLALAIGACSAAGASPADAGRAAQAGSACAGMGLSRADIQFDDCVTSLSQTLAAASAAANVQQARGSCSQAGLQPGTPAFANCVLDRDQVAK